MSEPHVVLSDSSSVLIDKELRMEHADAELCQSSTIEVLPGEIILEIFYLYKVAFPCAGSWEWQREWQKLAHVCRRWRTITFASQHRLDLRLLCTPKLPIEMTLDLWPAFPIVVQYPSGSLSPDDRDEITAVLQQHDRVCEIELGLNHSLSENESQIMQESFPLLESLSLCSWKSPKPVLPSTFLSGSAPRLRVLNLYGIAFPKLPRLLSSAGDLTDILLHRVPNISPEALVSGLSATARLKTLEVLFYWATSHIIPRNTPPPSSGRVIFSTLIRLKFFGKSNYLEDLLSRISAPSLKQAKIEFHDEPVTSYDVSQLSQFLGRVESQRPRNGAQGILCIPGPFVYRTGAQQRSPPDTLESLSLDLTLQVFERAQMSLICQQKSPFIPSVQTLEIHTSAQPLGNQDDVTRWLDLFRAFSRVERLSVYEESNQYVARALQLVSAELAADVLPALRDLTFDPVTSESREAVMSFIGTHNIAGFPAIAFHERMPSLGPWRHI